MAKQLAENIANQDLAKKAKRVFSIQLLSTAMVAIVCLYWGIWESVAAVYGGLVSICITALLLRSFKRASDLALVDPGKSMKVLYLGAAQRFLLVLLLVALGIAVLQLYAVALCGGLAIAQLSYLIGSREKVEHLERQGA